LHYAAIPRERGACGVQITQTKTDNGTTFKIQGELDISVAAGLQRDLAECLRQNAHLTVDLADVDACDTAALQLLCAARRTALLQNRTLQVFGLSQAVTIAAAGVGLSLDELGASASISPQEQPHAI